MGVGLGIGLTTVCLEVAMTARSLVAHCPVEYDNWYLQGGTGFELMVRKESDPGDSPIASRAFLFSLPRPSVSWGQRFQYMLLLSYKEWNR